MNIYCLVEGRVTEKMVYASWIPLVNPALRVVDFLGEVSDNTVYIISGEGMPQLFSRIAPSVRDIAANGQFDRFVVSVDSEEMSAEDKLRELMIHVEAAAPPVACYPIVQHYCFETWALGNRKIGSKRPKNPPLIEMKRHYDVAKFDPAHMTSGTQRLNRAAYSEQYLRLLLNDQNKNLTYSKRDPSVITHEKYFHQVKQRNSETGHIDSFSQFIRAFS